MPGAQGYGPAGKWVHDRAHRIMEGNPEMPKERAYAIAVQQGHKIGKTPKSFRTEQGVQTAKEKYVEPKKEYQKMAMLTAFFDELSKMAALGVDLRRKGPGNVKRPEFPTEDSKQMAYQKLKDTASVAKAGAGGVLTYK